MLSTRSTHRDMGVVLLASNIQRQRVISNILDAVRMVETCGCFHAVLPEVGSNIAMATSDAHTLEDVAGLTGRIIKVEQQAVAVGEPKFGATRFMGNVLLTAMRYDRKIASAMNIRLSPNILDAARELGLEVATYSWEIKPPEIAETKCGVPFILDNLKRVPDVVYDLGDLGVEPVTAIFGGTAVDVAARAIRIARRVSGE